MNRSARSVLWSVGGLGTRAIIQLAYFVLLARALGPRDYGAFASALAVIYIFVPYSGWGAADILVQNVSRNREKFGEYWGSAIVAILSFGGICFVLCLLVYWALLAGKVDLSPVILLALSELFFLRIIDTAVAAYQAFDLMARCALVQITFAAVRLCATLVFIGLIHDHSFSTWAVMYVASTICAATFCLIMVRRDLGRPRFMPLHIKNNLRIGFYFALSPSSQGVYNDFDKGLLAKYASLGIAGNYSAAYKILEALCVPMKAMLQTFYARFFVEGAEGINGAKKFAIRLFPAFFSYSALGVLLVVLFGRIVPAVFGGAYRDAVVMVRMLSPIIVLRAVHSLGSVALTGAGMQGRSSAAQVFVAILNALLCVALIPRHGWVGAAWASLLSDGMLAVLICILLFSSSQITAPPRRLLDHKVETRLQTNLD